MIYIPDANVSPNRLIPWIYIFGGLSIPQFSQVFEDLNFPIKPTEVLRQLAHDFVIGYHTNLGNPIKASASIDLLEGVSLNDALDKRVDVLFANTFSRLEQMGYAEFIYAWGKNTADYFNHEDVQQLAAWCRLLLKWAVLEQVNNPVSPDHEAYSTEWEIVIAKWLPIYTRTPPEPFIKRTLAPLILSKEARLNLMKIVLQFEAKRERVEATLEQMLAAEKSEWEDFMLRSGGVWLWMKGEGRSQKNLAELNLIAEKLSANEIVILNEWALADTYHKIKMPLPIEVRRRA
jgi:hypothetical protein